MNAFRRLTRLMGRIWAYWLLASLGLLALIPFYTTFVSATMDYSNNFLSFVPDRFLIQNVTDLLFRVDINVPYIRSYGNSFLVAASTTLVTGYFGLATAYGFALYSFKGKKALWAIVIALLLIPQTVSLMGFFKLVVALDMINTYWPLILPGMANAFVVFYLRQYLMTVVPVSLLEAARLDGAGEISIFHRLILPSVLPGIGPILIIIFLQSWNSYLLPLLVLNESSLKTIPVAMAEIPAPGITALSAAFSMVTMLALVGLFLKYFKHTNMRDGLHG